MYRRKCSSIFLTCFEICLKTKPSQIGYFQQVRRQRETNRFWNIRRPHKSQFLCNYTGQLTSIAFYGKNGYEQNKLSNRLFLNVNFFPVLKQLFLLKSNGWIASCPYFQWEKIDKLFINENFNLVRPTPVFQVVPLENTQWVFLWVFENWS
jgi:hypothetical protein